MGPPKRNAAGPLAGSEPRIFVNRADTITDDGTVAKNFVDLGDIDRCILAAEAYEYEVEIKLARLRRFVLNLRAYRDTLEDFGRALWMDAA